MHPRKRFLIALIIVVLAAAFCGTRVASSQERAKPRERGQTQTQTDRRRSSPPPKARQPQARPREGARQQDRARQAPRQRDEASRTQRRDELRQPQPQSRSGVRPDRGRPEYRQPYRQPERPTYGAQRRHPRPDGHYERRFPQWNRYHWYNWGHRDRWHRDRFPRLYFGLSLFDGFFYYGRPFGPHYRLWYYDRSWMMFYWPFPYPPTRGCGWYWVPTDRTEFYDPWTGDVYWDYTDYRYVYLCID